MLSQVPVKVRGNVDLDGRLREDKPTMRQTTPTTAVSRPATEEVWITKEQAAKILAVSRNGSKPQPISPRRILEFTQLGVLRSAKQRDPRSGQMMVVVSAADVERFRQERANPPVLPPVPRDPRPKLLAAPASPARAPVLSTPAPACAWLTLAEAEQYSGLPETFLLARIEAGLLPVLNVGIRAGGRYRINREDLDHIQGSTLSQADAMGVK